MTVECSWSSGFSRNTYSLLWFFFFFFIFHICSPQFLLLFYSSQRTTVVRDYSTHSEPHKRAPPLSSPPPPSQAWQFLYAYCLPVQLRNRCCQEGGGGHCWNVVRCRSHSSPSRHAIRNVVSELEVPGALGSHRLPTHIHVAFFFSFLKSNLASNISLCRYK